jgi:AcrR family transcriptional regulator
MSADSADQILDAARATVLDFGVRRTTVSEVARRAGLSRMTVYRRYPDGASLMRALMTREFGDVLVRARAEAASAGATGRERLVGASLRTIELLMTHPLMLRLLELDPEMLLPYLTERIGRFQELAREAVGGLVRDGQADGSIRGGDPAALAAACELAVRGLVIAARSLSARQRERALGEMRVMLDRYLSPA